ncbi:hypothetical protein KHR61_003108 [Salmonella enterica]|nr:hypothetical protein [Salmonella enterica]EDW4288913.1 hypothetical protein [Salmonella enterica subsp. diarizonae]EGO1765938.1 hypothetical protein [Salmonella enterica subsp. diarizonae serovar Rough:-:-]EAY5300802.1 hypothetical protein [Salmonella enterica]EBQ8441963.1 hypothetical protein [Salmonella enterica]
MKFKFGLNLPWGIYASIFTLLIIGTFIWDNVDSADTKELINYLCFILTVSIVQGALLIRMGKFEIYKNILNALWNIETAATFLYGMYVILEYSSAPSNFELPFSKWSSENLGFFTLIVIFFSVICIARAGYSIAEIFKAPILNTLPIQNKTSVLNVKTNQTNKNKGHSEKKRKK